MLQKIHRMFAKNDSQEGTNTAQSLLELDVVTCKFQSLFLICYGQANFSTNKQQIWTDACKIYNPILGSESSN